MCLVQALYSWCCIIVKAVMLSSNRSVVGIIAYCVKLLLSYNFQENLCTQETSFALELMAVYSALAKYKATTDCRTLFHRTVALLNVMSVPVDERRLF